METKEEFILDVYALEAGPVLYSSLLEGLNIEAAGDQKSFRAEIDGSHIFVQRMGSMVHIGVHRKRSMSTSFHEYIVEHGGDVLMSDREGFEPTPRAIELSEKLDKARRSYNI